MSIARAKLYPVLLASVLPLLILVWFLPSPWFQIDFWLLWLLVMIIVGLPLLYAEYGLAIRSDQSLLAGMQHLTRESDSSRGWRVIGWLMLLSVATLVVSLVAAAEGRLWQVAIDFGIDISQWMLPFAFGLLLVSMAIVLSLFKHRIGMVALIAAVIAIVIGLVTGGDNPSNSLATIVSQWQMTEVSLQEWGLAVALVIVNIGSGLGLYWHELIDEPRHHDTTKLSAKMPSLAQQVSKLRLPASRYILPIWATQLAVVVIAMLVYGISPDVLLSPWSSLVFAMALLAGAGFFCYIIFDQLSDFFAQKYVAIAVAIVVIALLSLLPQLWIYTLLLVVALVTALAVAVYAGWQVKISHLRKTLNFRGEGVYNLWRVFIRLVVPISIVIALYGLVSSLIVGG